MDTGKLKKFAQEARTQLMGQVAAKLELVLAEGSAARREAPAAVKELLGEIARSDKQQVIEKVAYTWFNRFTALRFMDANGLTNPRVVTPAEGQTRPELLADAAAGHMDETIPEATRNAVAALLDGRTPSRDAQGEAYRLLLVAACNSWHEHMPFMFEKIRDYTELLMPEDMLSQDSILSRMRAVMADEDCQDVEMIGWLYQFYVSEKKDQVFAALKKNVKLSPENIPAATQLFTPHWIVRYLVENSLGRLWLLNRPKSSLAARMDYYIAPEEPETDFLTVAKPEDLRICDPACGSGHMLTYAFDLLHAIYEEEGYDAGEIPALILTHNLHGIEIDNRAGALASFALTMKAAAKLGRRRFLRLEVKPNICVLQDVRFTPSELQDVITVVGRDLFTAELRETLGQFEQAKNFGSLIEPEHREPAEVTRLVRLKDFGGDLLLREIQERVLTVLEMARVLSSKYHIVVANPPYAGASGLNSELQELLRERFPRGKSDIFAAFVERSLAFLPTHGLLGMVTMESWMFLSSFEAFRSFLLDETTLRSMVHMPYLGKGGTSMGINFGTTAFITKKSTDTKAIANYCCVRYFELDERGVPMEFPPTNERLKRTSVANFKSIPGSPLTYWLPDSVFRAFAKIPSLAKRARAAKGLVTADNQTFVRMWHEVSQKKAAKNGMSREEAANSKLKWFPYAKGGEFRKWYGNFESYVNWENDGFKIQNTLTDDRKRVRATNFNLDRIFNSGMTWTVVTSGKQAFRYLPKGFLFADASGVCQVKDPSDELVLLGFLNSRVAIELLSAINPTLNLHPGYLEALPFGVPNEMGFEPPDIGPLLSTAKADWDAYETSWEFTTLPLLDLVFRATNLRESYACLRAHWRELAITTQCVEEQNNSAFISSYGLQGVVVPDVPPEEITLTCNPAYRYGSKLNEAELESRLLFDTMAEFLHYAVGCMFGRYSIDTPGLILASQNEGLKEYLARVPNPSFDIDADNVIPVLEGDWFADDITERFRRFLRVTFGIEKFQENLAFIEEALGKDIRKWFTKDFFDYHVRRYKKRPIYWMFSSPKGTFNALIYMHRYRPDTVSVVLNDYLRELISKLQAERARLEKLADDASVSQSQRTRALKEVGTVVKQIDELTAWERDVIFPLAQAKIEIDLDDGVKANYPKFGAALKPIKGLDAKEDE
jgi:hypothetical protein